MKRINTELLVIGGGASGIAAAVAAIEKGMKTVVVEPKKLPGGNGVFPRGIFAVDSVIQRHRLVFADTDELFRKTMMDSHWKLDGRILRVLLDKSGDTISWLMKLGVPICDVVHHMPNQTPEVFHITREKECTGMVTMKVLCKYVYDNGGEILTNTRAKKLLTDENKAVAGAVCVSEKDGEQIEIFAKKTIIATGGFSANPEMLEKFIPDFKADELGTLKGMPMLGEGIQMAVEAGADLEGHYTMEISAPKLKSNSPVSQILLGKPYNVWFNVFGKRFADEGIVYNFPVSANAFMRQPGSKGVVVFTQKMLEKTLEDGMDIIEFIHTKEGAMDRIDEDMQKLIDEGTVLKTDDVYSIADFIGCDPETFKREVDTYNASCLHGRDEIFAKERRNLIPLDEGPFYAVKAGTSLINTHGGIRIDEEFHALDSKHNKIQNLFIAGVDIGGVDADIYNLRLSGHGFGFALNSGRLAGEQAVKDAKI